ncbi:MAG: winged helix-turn-helix transcriptional regulator, partial [Proteobacteria bacterium]|nr:winged helix-turn-helix transcriptional regulator [Pseudomonadota bacterium]
MTNNATIPLYKVSKQTKLSVDAVNYRIKKMIETGVILKFIPASDPPFHNFGQLVVSISRVRMQTQAHTRETGCQFQKMLVCPVPISPSVC